MPPLTTRIAAITPLTLPPLPRRRRHADYARLATRRCRAAAASPDTCQMACRYCRHYCRTPTLPPPTDAANTPADALARQRMADFPPDAAAAAFRQIDIDIDTNIGLSPLRPAAPPPPPALSHYAFAADCLRAAADVAATPEAFYTQHTHSCQPNAAATA